MTVVTVVSLFNPTKNDLDRVKSFLAYTDRCILIDDSPNKPEQYLIDSVKESDNVDYYWNGKNLGLCKSLNVGIKKAIELSADWILFMDSDGHIKNDIIAVYKKALEKIKTKRIAVLAPQHNYERHKRASRLGFKSRKYVMLSGCLISVDAIENIGIFDERFFIDGLDYEWCLRAKKNNYSIIECLEAVIDHSPGTEKQVKVFGRTIFRYGWHEPSRYYYQFRAMWLLHGMYKDLWLDAGFAFKFLKILFVFDNKRDYLLAFKYAKEDYQRGYYGRYNH